MIFLSLLLSSCSRWTSSKNMENDVGNHYANQTSSFCMEIMPIHSTPPFLKWPPLVGVCITKDKQRRL
ncbi:hypothetical protein V6Z12_A01G143000 [Gossypium hirsutum]